jgi:hypothetical protein
MAVSDGKGAGSELIESIGSPRALAVAGAIALPGIAITLALVIWAIVAT